MKLKEENLIQITRRMEEEYLDWRCITEATKEALLIIADFRNRSRKSSKLFYRNVTQTSWKNRKVQQQVLKKKNVLRLKNKIPNLLVN